MLHYTAGHEDGVQQLYREDGSLYANYIVRDGRKYGLTGEKECANVLRQDTSYASAR